jgi:hypothetical protein
MRRLFITLAIAIVVIVIFLAAAIVRFEPAVEWRVAGPIRRCWRSQLLPPRWAAASASSPLAYSAYSRREVTMTDENDAATIRRLNDIRNVIKEIAVERLSPINGGEYRTPARASKCHRGPS